MDDLSIKEQYEKISAFLDRKQLKDALISLKGFISGIPDLDMHNTLDEIQTSYEYMLRYMLQGIEDSEREKVYNRLLATAYQLNDRARIARLTNISTRYYFDRLRYYKSIPFHTLAEIQFELESFRGDINAQKRHESFAIELFYLTWLSNRWSEKEAKEAKNLLDSPLVPENDLALFISGILLSLLEVFDIRKLLLLFDAYDHPSVQVNQRAIVAIALVISKYDFRLNIYPQIAARINLLNETPAFARNLETIQIQLLRSRETQKIDRKMREEIIPEMVKNMHKSNPKLGMDETDDEKEDRNPDWTNPADNPALSDKLKEMSELQLEGADVYMSTFSQLKGYPFFREMGNWFYPFDIHHSSVVKIFGNTAEYDTLLKNILQSGYFCNSDKYSFSFVITQIPQPQRAMMSQQLEEQTSGSSEEEQTNLRNWHSQKPDTVSNQYIHDLYRFFKIFPRRHEFEDIFDYSFNLQYLETFKETLDKPEYLKTLAEYFFSKNYLLEAYLIYEDIVKQDGGDSETFQKIGYSLQKNKNYQKAVEAYLQADLLNPDNIWTNKNLAICYRQLKQYEKALEYYHKVESVQPENPKLLTQIGICLTELKRCEEALAYFFKVEYLQPELPKTWRAIAWCSFLIKKYDQAKKYYGKLLDKETHLQDYLNAGHVAWVTGEIEKAAKFYAASLSMSSSREAFLSLFRKDEDVLIAHGIKKEDIPLMLDAI